MDNGRLTYSVAEAGRLLGLSRNGTYNACLSGRIFSIRIGKRVLIPKTAIEKMLNNDQSAPVGK
jgi:excisionase family DNA binding protein